MLLALNQRELLAVLGLTKSDGKMQAKAPITAATLARLFDQAFVAFLKDERENLLSGVAEQNLCGRFAMFLDRERASFGLESYFVDTEYNRNGGRVKTIIDEHMQIVTIRCDIILHSRGRIPALDNLLAIEMKRSSHSMAEKRVRTECGCER